MEFHVKLTLSDGTTDLSREQIGHVIATAIEEAVGNLGPSISRVEVAYETAKE